MFFNLFIILLLFIVVLIFIAGLVLLVIGLLKKPKRNGYTITGAFLSGIPLLILLIFKSYTLLLENYAVKPTQQELVGHYKISEVTNLDFDPSTFKDYHLELKSDSTFIMTKTPYIELCDTGKYEVDYTFENNELAIKCDGAYSMAHIESDFGGFRIEFTIDDPDSGTSIYFEKVEE